MAHRAEAITAAAAKLLPIIPLLQPLIVSLPLASTPEAAKAIFLWVAVGILGAAWLLARFEVGWPRQTYGWIPTGLAWGLGGFLTLATAATWQSDDPLRSALGSDYWRGGLATWACFMGLFLLSGSLARPPAAVREVFIAASVTASVISVISIGQYFNIDLIRWSISFDARVIGTFGSPIILGNFLAMTLPLTLSLFAHHTSNQSRLLFSTATMLQSLALLMSLSRGASFSALVGCLVLMIILVKSRAVSLMILFGAVIVATCISFVLRPSLTTIIVRMYLWKDSLLAIKDRPYFGYGFESYYSIYAQYRSKDFLEYTSPNILFDHVHNHYLDMAIQIGIPGALFSMLAYFLIFLYVFRLVRSTADRQCLSYIAGALGASTSYWVQGMFFFPTIAESTLFWLLAGTVLKAEVLLRENEEPSFGQRHSGRQHCVVEARTG